MEGWLLARANSLLDNLLFAVFGAGGTAMLMWIRDLPIPIIIFIAVALFVVILLIIKIIVAFYIRQTVMRLLKMGIYSDLPVNITRILYHDREKLAVGLSDRVTSNQDELVLGQLSLRNIVRLEQRKVKVFGSDNVCDEGYWILTELGKSVILYLQKHQQVLDKEGSLSI